MSNYGIHYNTCREIRRMYNRNPIWLEELMPSRKAVIEGMLNDKNFTEIARERGTTPRRIRELANEVLVNWWWREGKNQYGVPLSETRERPTLPSLEAATGGT